MERTISEDSKSERSSDDTLQSEPLGDDVEAEMQATGGPKMFKLDTASHVASALGSRLMQTPMAMDTDFEGMPIISVDHYVCCNVFRFWCVSVSPTAALPTAANISALWRAIVVSATNFIYI